MCGVGMRRGLPIVRLTVCLMLMSVCGIGLGFLGVVMSSHGIFMSVNVTHSDVDIKWVPAY